MSLEEFLSEWNNDSPFIEVKTSGSTGEPKRMLVEKRRMLASARITCDFLGLRPGDTALLCMSLDYIAGKMMVVRALERHLTLLTIPPTGHPLSTPALRSTFHLPPSTLHLPPSTFHIPHSTLPRPCPSPSLQHPPGTRGARASDASRAPHHWGRSHRRGDGSRTPTVPECCLEHLWHDGDPLAYRPPSHQWSRGLRVVHALPLCPSVPLRRGLSDHRCPRGLCRNSHHQRYRRIVSPRRG